MPAHEDDKEAMQKDLLQELRDLQTVLDSEADDAIPVLSDVVGVPPSADTIIATDESDAGDVVPGDEPDIAGDGVPILDSVTTDIDTENGTVAPATSEQSLDQLLAAEATKPAPFALIDSSAHGYDSSAYGHDSSAYGYESGAAESLIEEGLTEALQPLTEQMDDEALRLVDELVAEHSELIRQELKLRLDAKSKQLRAELAAPQGGETNQ